MNDDTLHKAARWISRAERAVAFTGAGISVESGIPPFRGENGLWNKYPAELFDISFFLDNPEQSWLLMREIFYELFGKVVPNAAHYALAELERAGILKAIITQNIDNLHTEAGSRAVYEFHGAIRKVICTACGRTSRVKDISLEQLPPLCNSCSGILKPDVVFFGEGIPAHAYTGSFMEAERSDLFLVIGSTGEVAPANQVVMQAKQNGAGIIEINPEPSSFTDTVTDIYLQGKAAEVMEALLQELMKGNS